MQIKRHPEMHSYSYQLRSIRAQRYIALAHVMLDADYPAATSPVAAFRQGTWLFCRIVISLVLAISAVSGGAPMPASAQVPTGAVLADGNAVVTGFSGIQLPTLIAPGVDPAERSSINLDGPVVRVIDLQAPGAPPQAQTLVAPKPFTVTAGQIGQVFGVALDNAVPPNIYVAATSVFGLPIVVPDANNDGMPDRAEEGTANATLMAGLFGPTAQGGGPGSIWRIDGTTGEVRLFANITLDGAANSGPALGGLAFDPAGNTLFVADRETGMIHRFDMAGAETGRYDHGTQGRAAAGLGAVPFDPAQRLTITRPPFQPANPDSWGLAPPPRRIFGLAVRDGRLYYAVAESLQIWSVAISPDGAFGNDARIEVTIPPGQSASEISSIAFDNQGSMLLAERTAPTGAFNFVALTEAGGRVLRYAPTPSATGVAWQPDPDEYAIGFPAELRNGDGGAAVGYGYDPSGRIDRNSCGGFLWSTGAQLRSTSDAALATQLASGGAAAVDGLQGNGIDLVRPANVPPLQSYFIDYDDTFDDPNARGHIGDIVVFRSCARARLGGLPPSGPPVGPAPGAEPGYPPGPPPGEPVIPIEPVGPADGGFAGFGPGPDFFPIGPWPDPPPPLCPIGTQFHQNGILCCPAGQVPGPDGQCRSPCTNGSTVPADMGDCRRGFQPVGPGGNYQTAVCWNNTAPVQVPDPACVGSIASNCWKCPKPPHASCEPTQTVQPAPFPLTQNSLWSNGTCPPRCLPPGWDRGNDGACHPPGVVCPAGQQAWPARLCCLNGTAPDNVTGQCAPGLFIPPEWYLDFLATGSGPCPPPHNWCSFYEFTITGRQRFGRGSLTQRITLPAGSDFPSARITRGAKYCPASAWSCAKTGDTVTCSAQNCGLAPGDQVVLRIEGKVAPNQTTPVTAPVEKTACGVLETAPVAGRGPAGIEQAAAGARERQRLDGQVTTDQRARTPSQQACWTVVLVPGTQATRPVPFASCAAGYAPTPDGQCCLAGQLTRSGICCPAGQRPSPDGRTCKPRCPEGRIWTGSACACPPGTIDLRGRCISRPIPPPPPSPPSCTGGKVLINGVCRCPEGTFERRGRCISRPTPPPPRPCTGGKVRVDRRCVCPQGTYERRGRCVVRPTPPPPITCPEGTYPRRGRCVPRARPPITCPQGTYLRRGRCVPRARPPITCPQGTYLRRGRCVPRARPPITCPQGTYLRRGRCVPRARPPITCPGGTYLRGGRCVPRPTLVPRQQLQQQIRRVRPSRRPSSQ
jgi:hypothetical protein